MKNIKTKFTLVAIALAAVSQAQADVRINGFANLTGGIASSGDSLFGYEDSVSFDSQSLFAVQVSGDINDKMTATGQIVARGNDNYSANFDWAYISYQATDNLSVSAGRLRLPLFNYSASLDVGYSYHWVAPPSSIYDVPFNNIDGVRFDYAGYSGDLEYTFQLITGRIKNDFTLAGAEAGLDISEVLVFTGDFTYENWKFRGVYGQGKTSFDIPALEPALGQLGQISMDLAGTLRADDDSAIFYGASIAYDAFNWFIAAEYTGVEIEQSFYPNDVNYYVTAGIRSGKWTPFLTYEKSDANDGPKFLEQVAGFPQPFQLPLTQLLVGIQQGAIGESNTVSAGFRYDFDTNVAFKMDVAKQSDDIGDDEDTLLRFAVNYVF